MFSQRVTPDPIVTLTASHCQLQDDQLHQLFSENPSDYECNQAVKVSVQILHHKQHIQFYSDDQDNKTTSSNTSTQSTNNSNSKNSKSKSKNNIPLGKESEGVGNIHPLFTDLPVGMRLLSTYQLGYFKDK